MTPKSFLGLAASAVLFAVPSLASALDDVALDPFHGFAASAALSRDSMGFGSAPLPTDFRPLQAPAASARAQDAERVLARAMELIGKPYRWGGTSPEQGFDCSGLVRYVLQDALDVELPRSSREMARMDGERVQSRNQLSTGDLVFFGRSGRVDHVGIYVGEGRFVHAPGRGKSVRISSLSNNYWKNRFIQAQRMPGQG
ncbi:C40 family peptidase [Coralloluteibacterium thermophilus]|uniref:C40 family peptidase n=1 Tax=Coralloluteibacterium thermophilum TaxID=2707049 RepID=A0ABV9NQ28_9GAMM